MKCAVIVFIFKLTFAVWKVIMIFLEMVNEKER